MENPQLPSRPISAHIVQFPRLPREQESPFGPLFRVMRALAEASAARRADEQRRELRAALARMSGALAEARRGLDEAIAIIERHEISKMEG
jgi:hypothetical protein